VSAYVTVDIEFERETSPRQPPHLQFERVVRSLKLLPHLRAPQRDGSTPLNESALLESLDIS
jgi:hypothetical protein